MSGGEPGHYGSQRVCLRYRPEMLEGVPWPKRCRPSSAFSGATVSTRTSPTAPSNGPRVATPPGQLAAWEAATEADPLFPLEVNWEAAERRLPDLWLECLKLHGETDQPVQNADELADILYRCGGYDRGVFWGRRNSHSLPSAPPKSTSGLCFDLPCWAYRSWRGF